MGQQEVYQFLKDHPDRWFTSKEISEALEISRGSATTSLQRLRKIDDVICRRANTQGRVYQHKVKE